MSEQKNGFPDNQDQPPPYHDSSEHHDYKCPPPDSQMPFLPPQQGYAPQQGYPPQQGYGYPPQGQGYAPPPQGYVVQGQPQMGHVMVQYPQTPGQMTVMNIPAPPDYLLAAICVTLFCFFPTGVFAIMRASDARSAMARGDLRDAEEKSKSAKKLINISIAVGILSFVFLMVLIGIYVGVILNSVNDRYDFDD